MNCIDNILISRTGHGEPDLFCSETLVFPDWSNEKKPFGFWRPGSRLGPPISPGELPGMFLASIQCCSGPTKSVVVAGDSLEPGEQFWSSKVPSIPAFLHFPGQK